MAKATKKAAPKKKAASSSSDIWERVNVQNALAYVPYLGAIVMYVWKRPSKGDLLHHIKYSALILVGITVLCILLNGFFGQLATLAYLGLSGFFAWKAYNGEKVSIEILDTIEDKISEKVKK